MKSASDFGPRSGSVRRESIRSPLTVTRRRLLCWNPRRRTNRMGDPPGSVRRDRFARSSARGARAAQGCDAAFELGLRSPERAEIFLPWSGFMGHASRFRSPTPQAIALAQVTHPAWRHLDAHGRSLQARNSHQVLGADLRSPVRFIACWTPGAMQVGGTAQAMRIADSRGIPIFNLASSRQSSIIFEAARRALDRKR